MFKGLKSMPDFAQALYQAPDTNTMYYGAMAAADLLKDRRGQPPGHWRSQFLLVLCIELVPWDMCQSQVVLLLNSKELALIKSTETNDMGIRRKKKSPRPCSLIFVFSEILWWDRPMRPNNGMATPSHFQQGKESNPSLQLAWEHFQSRPFSSLSSNW